QGAAREIDVVAQPALDGERAQADQGYRDRDAVRPFPLADEVVVRILEELYHIEIASTLRRPMYRRSKSRRVKKAAVKRLAPRPINKETPNPLTEPVPNDRRMIAVHMTV